MSISETTEVSAEICRDHLFDPELLTVSLPKGYRFIRAADYASDDPAVAGLIEANQTLRERAVGSLCFMSVGTFLVDGVRVHSAAPTPTAFWWARAAGPRDPRMQGKVEWLQLASWYSLDVTNRERIVAADPMAQFIDLSVAQTGTGAWRMRMALANEVVEAEARSTGPRKKRTAPEPGFMSVPFTGNSAGSFWVITYFGHHHQAAEGTWRASGSGVFTDALAIPGEAAVFGTFFQDGWSALSGVYRMQKPGSEYSFPRNQNGP